LQALYWAAFDPCLHDVFRAAIDEARGEKPRPWHDDTPEQKRRQAAGEFNLRAGSATSARCRFGGT
jgi:hypothetical protein